MEWHDQRACPEACRIAAEQGQVLEVPDPDMSGIL